MTKLANKNNTDFIFHNMVTHLAGLKNTKFKVGFGLRLEFISFHTTLFILDQIKKKSTLSLDHLQFTLTSQKI